MTPVSEETTFGRDWEEPWRARRIQQWLDRPEKQDLDASAAMQTDHLSLALVAAKPLMASIKPSDERARQALALVAGWDGVTEADRAEPLIAETFFYELHRMLLTERTGVPLQQGIRPAFRDRDAVAGQTPSGILFERSAAGPRLRADALARVRPRAATHRRSVRALT